MPASSHPRRPACSRHQPACSGPLAPASAFAWAFAACACLLGAGCEPLPPGVSLAPIPVGWVDGGPIHAWGSFGDKKFPVLVDTASVLTTYDDSTTDAADDTITHIEMNQRISLHDINCVERARFEKIQLLFAPLGSAGFPGGMVDVGGVIAGDMLRNYSLELRYGASPSIALLPPQSACSCALAGQCEVVLPFVLAGGGTIALNGNVYLYPPTRVTLDVCVGAVTDPVSRGERCVAPLPIGYGPEGAPGIDVRMLVATGFGGVLLSANAYDRMCQTRKRYLGHDCACKKTAAQLLAEDSAAITIQFPSPNTRIERAARIKLGEPDGKPPLTAMVLVGRERNLGPCQELARSRRLRAVPEVADCNNRDLEGTGSCLQQLSGACSGDPDRCSDRNQPAAAHLEIDEPIDIWVVEDSASILREANFDVRPVLSDVEGVIGNDLLARLEARIDYPNRRMIVHCAPGQCGCRAFPRYACPDGDTPVADCGPNAETLCNPPSSIRRDGPVCLPSPRDRLPGMTFDLAGTGACAQDGGT